MGPDDYACQDGQERIKRPFYFDGPTGGKQDVL